MLLVCVFDLKTDRCALPWDRLFSPISIFLSSLHRVETLLSAYVYVITMKRLYGCIFRQP